MTPQEIRDTIAASPALGALVPDTAALAQALSIGRTKQGRVLRADFAVWAGATGLRAAIEDHAANTNSPLRSSALTLKDFLAGAAETIDPTLEGNLQMLAAWKGAGAITQEQVDALLALGALPDPVSEFDVRCAIYDDSTGALLV